MFFLIELIFKITLLELLTPRNRVLEKLTGSQLAKKFLSFYVTRSFITPFTSVRHLSLSEPDKSNPCPLPYFLKIRFNIILPSIPGFSKTLYIQRRFRACTVVFIAILFYKFNQERSSIFKQSILWKMDFYSFD